MIACFRKISRPFAGIDLPRKGAGARCRFPKDFNRIIATTRKLGHTYVSDRAFPGYLLASPGRCPACGGHFSARSFSLAHAGKWLTSRFRSRTGKNSVLRITAEFLRIQLRVSHFQPLALAHARALPCARGFSRFCMGWRRLFVDGLRNAACFSRLSYFPRR